MSGEQICSGCGGQLYPGDRFCAHCGEAQEGTGASGGPGGSPWDPVLEKLRAATEGKYEIGRVLGTGGMAAVYLARETRLNRQVAIKVMSPGLMMQPGMIERFRHEAVTVAGLNHPNIVTIYTVEETDDLHFFVMEHIAGPSLEAVISRDGPLPKSVVKAWLTQIASALGDAHRQRVIHRDVKPANILLHTDGNAIVTDFGIAKKPRRSTLTQTGMTLGTPAYMSPEQCSSREVTASSDQYSLGIVAYEMLVGEPPFSGPSLEVMKAHVETRPIPITTHRPHCPADLVSAVERMLEKEPADRWSSLQDMIAAIGGAPIAHDDPIRTQLAALASKGGQRARLRVKGKGGVATASPPDGQTPIVLPARRPLFEREPAPPSPAVSPPAGQRTVTPPEEQEALPDFLKTETPAPVATLVLSPAPHSLWVGHTLQLEASPLDAGGRRLRGRHVTWQSGAPETADVSSSGVLTAHQPGTVRVTARCEGEVDTVELEIVPVRAASVKIRPWRRILAAGSSLQFKALVGGNDGSWLTDRPVSWASNDPAVIAVSGDGEVTAIAPGQAEVTATCEEQAGSWALRVVEPGAPYWIGRFWWTAPAVAIAILMLWLAFRPEPAPDPIPDPAPPGEQAVEVRGPVDPVPIDPGAFQQLARGAREDMYNARDAAITVGARELYAEQFDALDRRRGEAETAWIAVDYELANDLFSVLVTGYRELEQRARARETNTRSAAAAARESARNQERAARSAGALQYFPSQMGQAQERLRRAEGDWGNGRYGEAEGAFTNLTGVFRDLARRSVTRAQRAGAESARSRADSERLRAVTAGAPSRAADRLATLDRSYSSAESQMNAGQYGSATTAFDAMATDYRRLAEDLESQPPPPVEPDVVEPLRSADEVLGEKIERFRVLFASESLDRINEELYDGDMPSDDREMLASIFERADNIQAELTEQQLDVGVGLATANIKFRLVFTRARGGRSADWDPKFELSFAFRDGDWRLVRVRQD